MFVVHRVRARFTVVAVYRIRPRLIVLVACKVRARLIVLADRRDDVISLLPVVIVQGCTDMVFNSWVYKCFVDKWLRCARVSLNRQVLHSGSLCFFFSPGPFPFPLLILKPCVQLSHDLSVRIQLQVTEKPFTGFSRKGFHIKH